MYMTFGGNASTWADMTPQEQKMCFIVLGIIVIGLIGYGIYYYFKNRKKD